MGINDNLGNEIFLTWSARLKDLPKAIKQARAMAALGTTFRGCSFDVKVSYHERCPVCGTLGAKPEDSPYDLPEAHTAAARPRKSREGGHVIPFHTPRKSQGKS